MCLHMIASMGIYMREIMMMPVQWPLLAFKVMIFIELAQFYHVNIGFNDFYRLKDDSTFCDIVAIVEVHATESNVFDDA